MSFHPLVQRRLHRRSRAAEATLTTLTLTLALAACSTGGGPPPASRPPPGDGAAGLDVEGSNRAAVTRIVDGIKRVDVAPEPGACRGQPCLQIGASWTARAPEMATFLVQRTGDAADITAASVNINGRRLTLQPLGASTPMAGGRPGAQRTFTLGMEQARQLAGASASWLRVDTAQGVNEVSIADGKVDTRAFLALRRFVGAVDGRSMSILP